MNEHHKHPDATHARELEVADERARINARYAGKLAAQRDQAEAEVERLREALTRIAEQPASVPPGTPWKHWRQIAREALEAGER